MNSADVIAYHYDGGVICPDCFDADPIDNESMESCGGVVFADYEEETIGATCGCGACYGPDGWEEEQQILTDAQGRSGYQLVANLWRWSRCDVCNDQRPWRGTRHVPHQSEDLDARLAAIRGELHCRNCREPAVHF